MINKSVEDQDKDGGTRSCLEVTILLACGCATIHIEGFCVSS